MMKIKLIRILAAVAVLAVAVILSVDKVNDSKIREPQFSHIIGAKPDPGEIADAFLRDDFIIDSGFVSHLPIVVIDTKGAEIKENKVYDSQKGYMVDIPDMDPYVNAAISIFYNNTNKNSLSDAPAVVSNAKIKMRGNSSMTYEKHQYKINLLTETGQENKISLLGMDTEDEWILSISMIDKSLMRNYLAYTVAAQIMAYAPQERYCEVLMKNGSEYLYQGVYLLMDSVKQGPERIPVSKTKVNNMQLGYIVRRDRYDTDGVMLDTYATKNKLSEECLELLYPRNEEVNDDIVSYVTDDISKIEQVLYSDNPSVFLTYPQYINVDSFVDYYIINEYFTNYDAGFHSTYLYKDFGGKLCIGPVWDYDGVLDNYKEAYLHVDDMPFQKAPWFDRLMRSSDFVEKVAKRYNKLRMTLLSDKSITDTINETAAYLGPAEKRDWKRWRHIYESYGEFHLPAYTNDDGELFHRHTKTHGQELVKIRHLITTHAQVIKMALPRMLEAKDLIRTEDNTAINSILVIGFITAFFSSILIIRRL